MSDYEERMLYYIKRLKEYDGDLMEDDLMKIISYVLEEGPDHEEGDEVSTER